MWFIATSECFGPLPGEAETIVSVCTETLGQIAHATAMILSYRWEKVDLQITITYGKISLCQIYFQVLYKETFTICKPTKNRPEAILARRM